MNHFVLKGPNLWLLLAFFIPFWICKRSESSTGPESFSGRFDSAFELLRRGEAGAEAEKKWSELVQEFPQNSSSRFNLALALAQQKKWGESLGQLRVLLFQQRADSQTLATMKFIESQLSPKEPRLQNSGRPSWHRELGKIWWEFSVFLAVLAFFNFGLGWVRQLKIRRDLPSAFDTDLEELEGEALKAGLKWTHYFSFLLGLLCAGIGLLQWWVGVLEFSTVKKNSALFSFPRSGAAELSQLPEGLEVQVLQKKDSWLQVKAGDQVVGWIEKDQLLFERGL
ncbi:MAG: SH3 domain-containing protein [Bdellovibrio sp.]